MSKQGDSVATQLADTQAELERTRRILAVERARNTDLSNMLGAGSQRELAAPVVVLGDVGAGLLTSVMVKASAIAAPVVITMPEEKAPVPVDLLNLASKIPPIMRYENTFPPLPMSSTLHHLISLEQKTDK